MEQALKSGYYLAGFLSYEAGYSFEEKLQDKKSYDFPLIYMGIYEKPVKKHDIVGARRAVPLQIVISSKISILSKSVIIL